MTRTSNQAYARHEETVQVTRVRIGHTQTHTFTYNV